MEAVVRAARVVDCDLRLVLDPCGPPLEVVAVRPHVVQLREAPVIARVRESRLELLSQLEDLGGAGARIEKQP